MDKCATDDLVHVDQVLSVVLHKLQVAQDQHDVVKDSTALLNGNVERLNEAANELNDDDDRG